MNRFLVLTGCFFAIASTGWAMEADFKGYLRGGTGLNMEGGQQECFKNVGLPGNFLRLGNECGFYSELLASFNNKKTTENDGNYFKTQVRLQFESQGSRQWEPAGARDIRQLEAFVSAGGFAEVPGDFWVGKRFYRDADVHIFDWDYFADMSGVGGGVENLALGTGKLSVAHLIQGNETLNATSVGRPVLQAFDLRWKNLQIADQSLFLWGVYAWAPASSDTTTTYVATNGTALGARFEGSFLTGNNNFALLYGKGVMKDLNLYGSSALDSTDDSQNRAWTYRIVEDWNRDVTDNWAVMLSAAAEIGDSGATTMSRREWQEIGIRPSYYVTDRFQWVFETGYSRVKNEAEVDGAGAPIGERNLGRITIAPQLSMGKGLWIRPVMRAFISRSFWSSSNRGTSFVGKAAPTFKDKTEGTTFGYQFEAWF